MTCARCQKAGIATGQFTLTRAYLLMPKTARFHPQPFGEIVAVGRDRGAGIQTVSRNPEMWQMPIAAIPTEQVHPGIIPG